MIIDSTNTIEAWKAREFKTVNDLMRKSPRSSTGHGTGVLQQASLGTILKRDRNRLKLKQSIRSARYVDKKKGKDSARALRLAQAAERQRRDEQAKEARASRPGLGARLLGGLKRFLSRSK